MILKVRGLRDRFLSLLLISFIFSLSYRVNADGFGWYPILFDYQTFSADYNTELGEKIEKIEREEYLYEDDPQKRTTDWVIVDYLNEHPERFKTAYPQAYSGDLLWHQALMEIARKVRSFRRNSPVQYLLTGRLFLSPNSIVTCPVERSSLIHGACRTAIIFTDREVETVFWDFIEYEKTEPKYSDNEFNLEFDRIKDIFKEAALKKQGLYIYGHD